MVTSAKVWGGDFIIVSDSIFSCFTCSAVKSQPWVPPRLLFSFVFDIQTHPYYKFHYLTVFKSLWFPTKSSFCYFSGSDLFLLISNPQNLFVILLVKCSLYNSKCAIYFFPYLCMTSLFPLSNLLNIVCKMIYQLIIKLLISDINVLPYKFMLSPCKTN